MFLLVLGGSLVLGAGLLAAASLSGGALVSLSTAAQSIGWLFAVATVVGVATLRRGGFRQFGAAAVTFLSALTVLCVSFFEPREVPSAPISHAVAEPLPPAMPVVYKVVPTEPPAAVLPVATKRIPVVARVATPEPPRDPCDAQTGLAWVVCREKARLTYCEGREGDEVSCPSAIPFSPPG